MGWDGMGCTNQHNRSRSFVNRNNCSSLGFERCRQGSRVWARELTIALDRHNTLQFLGT